MSNETLKMRVSILQRCGEGKYNGITHRSTVLLGISLDDYFILSKILIKNVDFIRKLAINQLIKDELLRDTRTIRTILEKSEKEVVQ